MYYDASAEAEQKPPMPSVSEDSISKQEGATEIEVTPPRVIIHLSAKEIKIPAIVKAREFNATIRTKPSGKSTGKRAGFFIISQREDGTALFFSELSAVDVHNALVQIGARPGNNLSMEAMYILKKPSPETEREASKKMEGSPIEIRVSWAGVQEGYLLQNIITDSDGRGVEMRFGGNLSILQEAVRLGYAETVACFHSCPGAPIGNEKYSLREAIFREGRFTADEDLLPPDGTEVTITLKLLKQPASKSGQTDRPSVKNQNHNQYNVILISIDNLRADHLSSYGYHRETSPNIDRFAADGILFEQAISQSSWSLPSHASLFTSRFVSSHKQHKLSTILSDQETTLAEVLKKYGYVTGGFSGGINLKADWGLSQGFDVYFNDDSIEGPFEVILPKALTERSPIFLVLARK